MDFQYVSVSPQGILVATSHLEVYLPQALAISPEFDFLIQGVTISEQLSKPQSFAI